MERIKKYLKGLLIVFMVIIIISIIYATLTKRITMRHTSKYNTGYAWKVSFKNLNDVQLTGIAKEITKPTINFYDTRISTYNIKLVNPGDSATYIFDVVNEGKLNAILTGIFIPKPICIGFGNNAYSDARAVCRHLKYTLTYVEDGDSMYNLGSNLHIGDTLYKGQSRKLKLTLSYDKNVSSNELASNTVEIRNLDVALVYSECDKKCNVRGYNAPK